MRLFGLFFLLSTSWQSQTSATTEDPEKYCPCLPPRLCPRIFGQSPVDSKQLGQLPNCSDLTTVRCCGASLTVITEHLGTTKYDEDYLRHGKSPVYVPAKMSPVPIPENVMRQIEELGPANQEKQVNKEESASHISHEINHVKNEGSASTISHEINHSVHNDLEGVATTKSITIEKTLIANEATTPNPTNENSTSLMVEKCDGCDISSSSTENIFSTTEINVIVSTNDEMGNSQFSGKSSNVTDENISNGKADQLVESSTLTVGENVDVSSTTVLSDIKVDVISTTDKLVGIEDMDLKISDVISSDVKSDTVNDTKQTSENVAIVNAQPYNVKTMRNLEMPREVYIILPNEETGRMVYENMTDDSHVEMNENKMNSSIDQVNEIADDAEDDQIQNATNRQEIIESIVFQNWENENETVTTEQNNVSVADEVVEETSKGSLETTTKTKTKRTQIRHNLYTRKPNSILLPGRNKINEVTSTTTVSPTTRKEPVVSKKDPVVIKKDESAIRREEIERISNLTRDQVASGSEHVPVVVRKLPPPQFKEPTRGKVETSQEEESDVPPVRVPHFRHPPRVLKPVTTTKQPPVVKNEKRIEKDMEEGYDYASEEGEETNNDEVVIDGGEEEEFVRTPQVQSRRRLIGRSRGGSLFKNPTVEVDKSVDTSEEERAVAMHEFKKIRGQNKFRNPVIETKQTPEPVRDVVTEGTRTLKSDRVADKPIARARVRTSLRTETVTFPDLPTTVSPITTTTILPSTSPRSLNVDEEDISTTQPPSFYDNNGDSQDDSLLEAMEPRTPDTELEKTPQVKQSIELYEGKRLTPLRRNQNQEVHTGRGLFENKKDVEHVTDGNVNTEEKLVTPKVHRGRNVVRKPIVVAPIQTSNNENLENVDELKVVAPIETSNNQNLENVDKLKVTKSENKPSITDEINDKETRQQNSGLQPVNRQRSRNSRLKVTAQTPQVSKNDATQTVIEQTTTAPLSTTESPPPQPKRGNANFRGNFLRSRNRIGMIENIIKEQMLMEHAALKSRMLRNAVESGKTSGEHDEVGQSAVNHDNSEGAKSTDQDLESEGSEPRIENRQVPSGFKPPTRMERGFVPIIGQTLKSTSAFTEDGIPVKQLLLPEESKPPPSFNEVQPQTFQNNLKVVGPIPSGFHHEALRSTSALTEDGIPVTQFQLPEQLKPAQNFNEDQNRNSKSLSSKVEIVRVNKLELPTDLVPPPLFNEEKQAEEPRTETPQKDPLVTKRTLTELVPPAIEAIFFRRNYDDTLVEYNQALMKYNDYISKFLEQQPLNARTSEVKSV